MTPVTLLLVLGSAVVHSIWNLWTKQIRSSASSATLMWVLTGLSALAYAPIALVVARLAPMPLTATTVAWILASSLLHVGYFLLLLRGYRVSDLSVVYPVARGSGPLLASLGAMAWLAERPTAFTIAGIALVTAGILVLTVRGDAFHAPHLRAGILYGLLTGLTIGAYTLWDGAAVSRLRLTPLVYYWCGEAVRAVLFTPFGLADRSGARALWREHRARVLGIAILSPLSYVLMLLALSIGKVSHVAPARELSILFGAWLGARVLGEGDRTRRMVAAAAFASGVIALALG